MSIAARSLASPPLTATIRRVAPRPPDALMTPEAMTEVFSIADQLPAALTRWLYLECRLAAAAPQVDLIVSVEPDGRGCLLSQQGTRDDALLRNPIWQRVLALCTLWERDEDGSALGIERLWLEFDADDRARRLGHHGPVPGVFCDLTETAYSDLDLDAQLARIARLLTPLMDHPPAHGSLKGIRRVMDLLPPGAHVVYVGYLPARGRDTIRLCARAPESSCIPAYLEALHTFESEDDRQELAMQLATLRRWHGEGRETVFHLDLAGDVVEPSLMVEYPLRTTPQIRGRFDEVAYLDALVHMGLCTPAKRHALNEWPGIAHGTLDHECWSTTLVRRVNHVKLVFAPGGVVAAKAYPCLFNKPRALTRAGPVLEPATAGHGEPRALLPV